MMARAATAPELALLRTPGQWSELYLAVQKPAVVYSARINQTFSSYDDIAQLTYDGATGTLADVLPGMTIYVGSSAGAYDKGMCRVRKAPTATVLYIGRESEIAFADNDYLTVVDEFGLWSRHWLVKSDGTALMDYDVAYTNQHASPAPVPNLGPIAAVLWLTGSTVNFAPDASGSWVLGGTISSYSWSAPGASATANLTTATPTITYNAAGTYRVSCTITASNGVTATGYRWVFVYSAASLPGRVFQLDSCDGSRDDGGWSFTVTMYAEAALSDIRDRAMVTLFAKDHYGTTAQSIGPVTGYENVICSGWVEGESIVEDPDQGTVRFTVRGPAWWLAHMADYPIGLDHKATAPTKWLEFQNLTVDKFLWHVLTWHTTAPLVIDVTLTGDTKLAQGLSAPLGAIWQQLSLADTKLAARPLCDRYGRLFVEIDTQYLAVSGRSVCTTVQALTKADWEGKLEITRRTVPETGMLDLSGVAFDGTKATPYFALSPGKVMKRFGRIEQRSEMVLSDQAQANVLAGAILGQMNNDYPRIAARLASNHRLIDITPRQCLTLDVSAADTLRGFSCVERKLLPRSISYTHDTGTGFLQTAVDFEAESWPETAVSVPPPQTPVYNIPPQPGLEIPDFPIAPIPTTPPIYPPPSVVPDNPPAPGAPCRDGTDTTTNGPWNTWTSVTLLPNTPQSYVIPMKFYARPSGATNPTRFSMYAQGYKLDTDMVTWIPDTDRSWWHIYLDDCAGNRLANVTLDADAGTGLHTGGFDNVTGIDVCGIEIALDAELIKCDHIARSNNANPGRNANISNWSNSGGVLAFESEYSGAPLQYSGDTFNIVPPAGQTNAGLIVKVDSSLVANVTTQNTPPWWHYEEDIFSGSLGIIVHQYPSNIASFTIAALDGPYLITNDAGGTRDMQFTEFAEANGGSMHYGFAVGITVQPQHKLVVSSFDLMNICANSTI